MSQVSQCSPIVLDKANEVGVVGVEGVDVGVVGAEVVCGEVIGSGILTGWALATLLGTCFGLGRVGCDVTIGSGRPRNGRVGCCTDRLTDPLGLRVWPLTGFRSGTLRLAGGGSVATNESGMDAIKGRIY